jgi:acetylornithine deacetylase/succinyl-diaminopimelate desuccinylase-like protein
LVVRALADADADLERFVDEWVRIAEIPAPSGGEGKRAAYIEGRFRELGLDPVAIDTAGNVVGLLKGRDPSLLKVAVVAHMDTVASAEADHSVQRLPGGRGGSLKAPGVRDDSSGLAGMLAAVTLMRRHGLVPQADTWVVASAREEVGLKGAESFTREHATALGAFIALDGQLGQISYAATGILWLKLHFLGEGGHTLKAHEKPSAILAAARCVERISAIPLRRSPESMESWLNIGSMGGGDVPNAQARDAWFTVDLRSNDPAIFEDLERRVLDAGRQTAKEVGVRFEPETMHRMSGGAIPGFADSVLVRSARQALEELGWEQINLTPRGTADHNVAIVRGIPGIAIGVTTGDGAHTPEEFADIAPFATGVKQIVLLLLMPLTATAR